MLLTISSRLSKLFTKYNPVSPNCGTFVYNFNPAELSSGALGSNNPSSSPGVAFICNTSLILTVPVPGAERVRSLLLTVDSILVSKIRIPWISALFS